MSKSDPRVAQFRKPRLTQEEIIEEAIGHPLLKPKEPAVLNKGWDADPKACLGKRWAVGQDHTELLDAKGKQLLDEPVPRYTRVHLNMLHNSMSLLNPRRLGRGWGIGR